MTAKRAPDFPASIHGAPWTFSPDPALDERALRLFSGHPPFARADLTSFRALMKALDDPQERLPFIFHVAGTNGKGSVLAFVQAILESAGLAVHKNTSPHLVRIEERFVVAGRQATPASLTAAIDRVMDAASHMGLKDKISFFEILTGAAFVIFAQHAADAVLLETGLGGRLDATNVVTRDLAILTRISFDHVSVLGDSLPAIAAEKAGIIKPGCPVILAPQPDTGVVGVFGEHAARKNAAASRAGRDWDVFIRGDHFAYRGKKTYDELPLPALAGAHQVVNAATAIAAVESSPFAPLLTEDILRRAMKTVRWPGRMQRLPDRGNVEIWLDGAHNDSGAEVLKDMLAQMGDDKPFFLVTAFKDKKDIDGFYQSLAAYFARTVVTCLPASVPSAEVSSLVSRLRNFGYHDVSEAENAGSAIDACVQAAPPEGARIVVTGSLFLVGEVLRRHGNG